MVSINLFLILLSILTSISSSYLESTTNEYIENVETVTNLPDMNSFNKLCENNADSYNIKNLLERVTMELGKFHEFYLTNLDYKIIQILSTTIMLDSNIKSLQERLPTLDLLQRQINDWSKQMETIDQKINILQKSNEDINRVDNKLFSIEYTLSNILNKVNTIDSNSKTDDNNNEELKEFIHMVKDNERKENLSRNDIINRLNSIQRQISYIERTNYKPFGHQTNNHLTGFGLNSKNQIDLQSLMNALDKINRSIDKPSVNDFKQLNGNSKKLLKSLDNIAEILKNIDERTIQLYDCKNNQYTKMITISETMENEVASLKNITGIIINKNENFILSLQRNIEHFDFKYKNNTSDDILKITDATYNITGSNEFNASASELPKTINFSQPHKNGCHQLEERINGIYKFSYDQRDSNSAGRNFNERYCEFSENGFGWTVIQRRGPYEIQENFNRSWIDYKNGFGDLNKEFWLGNDFLHKLTYEDNLELKIIFENWEGVSAWTEYSLFRVDAEKYNYNLMLSGYIGNISDSFLYHNDQDFSTFDKNNDNNNSSCCSCSISYGSGWWFNNCIESNLNGIYQSTPTGNNYIGIIWQHWLGDYSLKSVKMMVRPKDLGTDNLDDP